MRRGSPRAKMLLRQMPVETPPGSTAHACTALPLRLLSSWAETTFASFVAPYVPAHNAW